MSTPTLPRTRNREQLEKWLGRQKRVSQTGQQAGALDATFPGWRDTLECAWRSRLEATAAYVSDHGRFPRSDAGEKDERVLGIWIATQRYQVERLSAERRALLDGRLPGWNRSVEDIWEARFRDLTTYFAVHGEMPLKNAEDAATRSSSFWLNNQRKLPKNGERRARLNQALPGWDRSNEDLWEDRLSELAAFVHAHGRLPKQNEKAEGGRRSGIWLSTQRATPGLSARRRNRLNESVPGWDKSKDDRWSAALEYVAAYLAEHGKLPSSRSRDAEVAFHGRWLGTQRRSQGTVASGREAELDERIPPWRETAEDKWLSRLRYVAEFEKVHGRFPSYASADAEELVAARWLGQQKQGVAMTPERSALLDSTIPRWRETADDLWLRRLEDCAEFFRIHGRRPKLTAAGAGERSLASWFNNMKESALSPERLSAMNAVELGDMRTHVHSWNERLEMAARFVDTHGRFPASTNKVPGERALAAWLVNQRLAGDKLRPERRAALSKKLPGWDMSRDTKWNQRLEECVTFVRSNGRFPRAGATVPEPERQTGQWYFEQRKPRNHSNAKRAAMLNERLPGWND